MQNIVHFIKNGKFQIGMILCFLLPPVGILLLFLFGLGAIYEGWKDRKSFSFSFVSMVFFLLLVSTVCASFQMENASLLIGSLMVLGYWGLYLFVRKNGTRMDFHTFKWIIIFGGIYNCIVGWTIHWITINPLVGFLTGTTQLGEADNSRLFGSSYNSNFTMYLLLVAIAFMLAEINAVIRKKTVRPLYWQIPLLLILIFGVFSTGSRAGYISMIIVFMLFFLRLNKIVFMSVSTMFIVLFKKIYELMPRNDNVLYSTYGRENIWSNSIELWKQHFLFGTTPLGFRSEYFKLFNDDMVHAHNLFIGFFAEYGIVGGIALLILLFSTTYKFIILLFLKNRNKGLFNYFLFSLPIIVLTGILDEPTFSPQIALLTVILLSYWKLYTSQYSVAFLNVKLKKFKKMPSGVPFHKKFY
ncbi:O-antigen ligase family protein [Bacillus sp. BRMEA1]|uniref:O-antigen ligase family protein n=1 Tax=Neobacillus endophyticus TaxID=2738405 RepID=UPI001566AAF3|nr:O-antigen ligase family protein [Neobacillus endophyticus]NRD80076.1 O-antigen ligase family protein [Neobacillus endophyticus]